MKSKKLSIISSYILAILFLTTFIFYQTCVVSAEEKTLRVGATSNFGDRQGIQVKKCLELAAEQLNKAGGLVVKKERYRVEMIVYDDKFQADAARAAFERLVYQDKVKIVFSIGTAPVLAGIEITDPNKVLLFHGGFSSQVLSPRYKYAISTRPNTLGFASSGVFWKKHLKPETKTAVVIAYDDHGGHVISDAFEVMWKHCGLKILGKLYCKRGTVDLNPLATKLKALNPDIVEYAGIQSGAGVLNLYKAIYQSGWRGKTSAEQGGQTTVPDIINVCGRPAVEGMTVMIIDPTMIPNPSPLTMAFRKGYTEKYGEWEVEGLRVFDGWYYFVEAVKKADSLDPDAIIDAMQGLSVETVMGTARMSRRPDLGNNRYVDSNNTKYFGEVRNGNVVYLDRVLAIEGIRMAEQIFGGGKWE